MIITKNKSNFQYCYCCQNYPTIDIIIYDDNNVQD
jgi:hypothetical protein